MHWPVLLSMILSDVKRRNARDPSFLSSRSPHVCYLLVPFDDQRSNSDCYSMWGWACVVIDEQHAHFKGHRHGPAYPYFWDTLAMLPFERPSSAWQRPLGGSCKQPHCRLTGMEPSAPNFGTRYLRIYAPIVWPKRPISNTGRCVYDSNVSPPPATGRCTGAHW